MITHTRYYVPDDPSVADAEYDRLYDELAALEKRTGKIEPDSPDAACGQELLEGFQKTYAPCAAVEP